MRAARNRAKPPTIDRRPQTTRSTRRGRPPKFGRPSQLVALTLPDDVLASLQTIHHDPAWAVVRLVESSFVNRKTQQRPAPALAELVHLPGKRGLIVVQTNIFGRLHGISTIPLADGRAFLAFDRPAGLADLEVAILDRLALIPAGAERTQLTQILEIVRGWRRHRRLNFRTKSIIVVESPVAVESGSLRRLSKARRSPRQARTRRSYK